MVDGNYDTNGAVDNVTVEMGELNKALAASINQKLSSMSTSSYGPTSCIYRVNEKFRKISEHAYTPQAIAIGPYHRGIGSLQAMEEHKCRYVRALLRRITTGTSVTKLEECVEALRKLEESARECYSEPINLNSNEFVEMMLVDGLFIVELIRKCAGEVNIDDDDSIFNSKWGIASIVRDMILLENQIPMIVLECLFNLTKVSNQEGRSLTELALRFFNPLMRREEQFLRRYFNYTGKHLLDLSCNTFEVSNRTTNRNPYYDQSWKFLPCVTELKQAGVRFKKGTSMTGSFLDIKFNNGVLEIPQLFIQDQTNSYLRNLIALEQCCHGRSTYITSYAFLMDSLINSADDVGFLRRREIITNFLGDDRDVSLIFNELCNEVTLVDFCYSGLCDQVNAYSKTRWHIWKATLRRDYSTLRRDKFHSPWAILSFLAAILLLILTFTATLFSILSFSVHGS